MAPRECTEHGNDRGGLEEVHYWIFFVRLPQTKRITTEDTELHREKLHGGTEELRKNLCGFASVLSVSSVVKAFLN